MGHVLGRLPRLRLSISTAGLAGGLAAGGGLVYALIRRAKVPAALSAAVRPLSTKAPDPYPIGCAIEAITEKEVLECQDVWAKAIVKISMTYKKKGDFIQAAADAAGQLYGYGHHNVLFKPTKATKHPFRPTAGEAMSYFVGGTAVDGGYVGEDAGFAINGGKCWRQVTFNNHQIDLNGPVAIAMGAYDFVDDSSGDVVNVEYTLGYKRCADGKPRIFLHHSSMPFSPL